LIRDKINNVKVGVLMLIFIRISRLQGLKANF
jgi:hypothetical protein